jgi:hypothetical protein
MVTAMRVTLIGTRLTKDCGYAIEWVSKAMPEGDYSLSIEGKTIKVHHSKGAWGVTQV